MTDAIDRTLLGLDLSQCSEDATYYTILHTSGCNHITAFLHYRNQILLLNVILPHGD